jgi:hypothetical protein
MHSHSAGLIPLGGSILLSFTQFSCHWETTNYLERPAQHAESSFRLSRVCGTQSASEAGKIDN